MTTPDSPLTSRLTDQNIRELTAAELGVEPPVASSSGAPGAAEIDPFEQIEALPDDDPMLQEVQDLLKDYGGIVFTGPPGTSKSWYAARIGVQIADRDPERIRFVQFHPSYQYEDFIQGFVPRDDGSGFKLVDKHLLELCELGDEIAPDPVVLVIDELSRGDPGRIFGEALTYVERTKRGLTFHLASGKECSIPDNVVFLATMNPHDRGVDEVDAAFDRRFAKIRMDPRIEQVSIFLQQAGMPEDLRSRVETFFRYVQKLSRSFPYVALGHTFFAGVSDVDGLRSLWDHQLSFHFEKFFRLDPDRLTEIRKEWDKVMNVETVEDADGDAGEE
jgi:5-methylcytosine-specific restriction protein B